MTATDAPEWLQHHPEIEGLRAAVCDLNGNLRGKGMPLQQAIEAFERGKYVKRIFDTVLRNALVSCRQQERSVFTAQVTEIEHHSYLETA